MLPRKLRYWLEDMTAGKIVVIFGAALILFAVCTGIRRTAQMLRCGSTMGEISRIESVESGHGGKVRTAGQRRHNVYYVKYIVDGTEYETSINSMYIDTSKTDVGTQMKVLYYKKDPAQIMENPHIVGGVQRAWFMVGGITLLIGFGMEWMKGGELFSH